MCGIGGILFSKSSGRTLKERVALIEKLQLHRGPDEQNIWMEGNHAICHQRLSIIDLKSGKQPMLDVTGRYILTFNGELYNYKLLKKELAECYNFQTHSDSEVLLASYIIWGKACLDRFIGMFAFLILDTLEEKAFAARDALGVKPFVYTWQNNEFIFSSEVKAILPLLQKREVNPVALAETIIAPSLSGVTDSLFMNVNYLPAGTYMEISRGKSNETTYTSGFIQPEIQGESTVIDEFGEEFEKSIAYSLESDVEIGCFLSGGLDSSYIAAQAGKFLEKPLKTYGISFQEHDKILFSPDTIVCSDDKPFTDQMVKEYGFNHTWVEASQTDIAKQLYEIACINDRIPVWEQEIAQHFLSIRASKDLKTVLVGDAADEMNYGYFFLLNQEQDTTPMAIANLFGGKERINLLHPRLNKKYNFHKILCDKYEKIAETAGFGFKRSNTERILATSAIIIKFWLGRLLHNGDIHTMNSSLEGRVPFANQNLIAVSKGISPLLGFKNDVEKNIVRQAAKKVLIDKIRLRKKSALPRDPRMGEIFKQILTNQLKEENPFIDQFLNRKVLTEITNNKAMITEMERMMLFNTIMTINWSKKYAI